MSIYTEYAKIKVQMAELTEKQKELEGQILSEVKNLSAPMKTDVGTFTTVSRKSYSFSESTIALEKQIQEELKAFTAGKMEVVETKKKQEIDTGIAQVTEVVGLRYIAPKPSN